MKFADMGPTLLNCIKVMNAARLIPLCLLPVTEPDTLIQPVGRAATTGDYWSYSVLN